MAACLEDAEEKPQNPDEDPEGQQGQVHYQADEDPDAHDGEEYEPQQHEGREDQPGEYHHFPFNITSVTFVNKHDSATEAIFKAVHEKQQPSWGSVAVPCTRSLATLSRAAE